MAGSRIRSIETTRVDIRVVQPISMSFGTITEQHIVLVRMRDEDGIGGIGEASILGGPRWNQESAEGVQATIERYLAPVLVGQPLTSLEALAHRLAGGVRGNAAARHAVETAGADLIGRRLGVSVIDLLGGRCHARLPVAWTLSTGDAAGDIAEGERALAERGHTRFKLKFGSSDPAADVARAVEIIRAFAGRATIIADVNQGWSEVTAARWLPRLQEAGLEAIEQPLRAGEVAAAARLRAGLGIEWIADEGLVDEAAVLATTTGGAASAIALKPGRDGGLVATKRVAAIARAGQLGAYGGTMLETSIGTAASASLFSTMPELSLGTELFGPLRLEHDLAVRPLKFGDGRIEVPTGPGLGVELDEGLVSFLSGARRSLAVPRTANGASGPPTAAHADPEPIRENAGATDSTARTANRTELRERFDG